MGATNIGRLGLVATVFALVSTSVFAKEPNTCGVFKNPVVDFDTFRDPIEKVVKELWEKYVEIPPTQQQQQPAQQPTLQGQQTPAPTQPPAPGAPVPRKQWSEWDLNDQKLLHSQYEQWVLKMRELVKKDPIPDPDAATNTQQPPPQQPQQGAGQPSQPPQAPNGTKMIPQDCSAEIMRLKKGELG